MSIPITKISIRENVTLITLRNIPTFMGLIWEIFTALSLNKINIDMISQTSPLKDTVNVSFTIKDTDLFLALKTVKIFKAQIPDLRIDVNSNNVKIALQGEEIQETPGVAAKTLEILTKNNISILMITTSDVDISYLINSINLNKTYDLFKEAAMLHHSRREC